MTRNVFYKTCLETGATGNVADREQQHKARPGLQNGSRIVDSAEGNILPEKL